MEVLVYNVSHSDLIVSLAAEEDQQRDGPQREGLDATSSTSTGTRGSINEVLSHEILAKPKFSCFQPTSERILDALESLLLNDGVKEALVPEYSRDFTRPNLNLVLACRTSGIPVGFRLDAKPIPVQSVHNFRVRGGFETLKRLDGRKLVITGVYFPLLSMLLPKWTQILHEAGSSASKRVIYLISGAGIPRNPEHSMYDNSTIGTAKIMQHFIELYHPGARPIHLHSGSNIFTFDDNVHFVNNSLRAALERQRAEIADNCEGDWINRFHVTIAIGDGAPARLVAINASLRHYCPSYLHIWQLKTFWHEQKISMEDIEFHNFASIESSPAMEVHKLDDMARMVVAEVIRRRDLFQDSLKNGNELAEFWLRKSKKPVIAVLAVQKDPHEEPKLYCGTNLEVSMPTGSLCAERNVIGNALANDLTLRRRDLKMVAVMSLAMPSKPLPMARSSAPPKLVDAKDMPPPTAAIIHRTTTTQGGMEAPEMLRFIERKLAEPLPTKIVIDTASTPDHGSSAPSSPGSAAQRQKKKRPRTYSVDEKVLVEEGDRNPLPPCGACKEWLKKIAEVNPTFRVLTFTDMQCSGVYVNLVL